MYVSSSPTFRPHWLRSTPPGLPDWLDDETWVPPGNRAVYSYARSGLLAILNQLDPGLALLPEYLPPGVVACFTDAGFDVEFYGIGPDFQLPIQDIDARLRSTRPAIVLFVHYFGFAAEGFPKLAQTAREVRSFVIEDVARGLFARDRAGRLLGSTGDAAIFSLRKVLPVPRGGLVVARTLDLVPPSEPLAEGRALLHSLGATVAQLLGWAPITDTFAENDRLRFFDYTATEIDQPPGLWPPRAVGPLSRTGLHHITPSDVRAARQRRYELAYERLSTTSTLRVLSPPPDQHACPYGVIVSVDGGPQLADRLLHTLRHQRLPVEAFRWPTGIDPREANAYPGVVPIRFSTFVLPTHPQIPLDAIGRVVNTIRANI